MKNETQIMVRMSVELKNKLEKLADQKETSISSLIRSLIQEKIGE